MRDMVQEMWEDRKESIVLQEKLMAMKEEKHLLLEKLHEMETQLHEAKETLTKYMHEHEVRNVGFSSNSSQDECFGVFENHTRGIGSKLLLKMGYEGRGLGKHVQVIVEPIVVEERPKHCGLGYEQKDGAYSKVEETKEKVPRTTFVSNKRVVIAMRTRTFLLVFKRELVTLQIHLLKKAIKVNVQELLFQVQSLKHEKFVFKMNANV
jgi:hypothetical protein